MQCGVAGFAGGGRADRGELHEWKCGGGSANGASEVGSADGRCRGTSALDDGGQLGSAVRGRDGEDRKSTRLNSSHTVISYAVFCLKKKQTSMYTRDIQ